MDGRTQTFLTRSIPINLLGWHLAFHASCWSTSGLNVKNQHRTCSVVASESNRKKTRWHLPARHSIRNAFTFNSNPTLSIFSPARLLDQNIVQVRHRQTRRHKIIVARNRTHYIRRTWIIFLEPCSAFFLSRWITKDSRRGQRWHLCGSSVG